MIVLPVYSESISNAASGTKGGELRRGRPVTDPTFATLPTERKLLLIAYDSISAGDFAFNAGFNNSTSHSNGYLLEIKSLILKKTNF